MTVNVEAAGREARRFQLLKFFLLSDPSVRPQDLL